jgi:hypothetical protein
MKKLVLLSILVSACLGYSQNCPPVNVCSNFSTTPSGFGTQEINSVNNGCLSQEHNSTWLMVNILNTGTFNFIINPNVNSNDFDFAVYADNNCPPTADPIRCSFAIQAGPGNTGLNNSASDLSEGVFGDQFVQFISAIAGETYVILVDNFTTNSGFQISFGGTAVLNCMVLPIHLTSIQAFYETDNTINPTIIKWQTTREINLSKHEIEKSYDGRKFQKIGELKVENSPAISHDYLFQDLFPTNGTAYYRIRSVDSNGIGYNSEVVFVTRTAYSFQSDYVVKYKTISGQDVVIEEAQTGVYIKEYTHNQLPEKRQELYFKN